MSLEETFEEIVRRVVREELAASRTEDKLLTAEQVADELGYTDVKSVYRLKKEKQLPAIMLGENSYRFRRSDVRRFIESRAQ